MEKLQAGNLVIRSLEERLIFEIQGESLGGAEVSARDLPIIVEFLKAHQENHSSRRMGFGLDLTQILHPDLARLRVYVESEEGIIQVQPTEFSVTGICVETSEALGEPGDRASICILFETQRVQLDALIVRHGSSNRRFAFHFTDVFGADSRLDPPRELTTIFYALESMWLNENLDLKWNLS